MKTNKDCNCKERKDPSREYQIKQMEERKKLEEEILKALKEDENNND